MKIYSPLILLACAFVLFLVGISIPHRTSPLHIAVVVLAVLLGLIFYLKIFREVFSGRNMDPGDRTLWLTTIIVLPLIGDLLYVLIYKTTKSKQVPKPEL